MPVSSPALRTVRPGVRIAESSVTNTDRHDKRGQERAHNRLSDGSLSGKRSFASQGPHYLDFEEARQLLAGMNVHLTRRQIKRSSDKDATGKRKLPWFIDPIEG
jgi:hypothetical protein